MLEVRVLTPSPSDRTSLWRKKYMYRPNRPLWLKFSKANLDRFPDRKERYKAFLRECYEPAKPFSIASMQRIKEELNLPIPLDELVSFGNQRNWLTKDGKPYQSVKIFCTVWNGIWLEERRKKRFISVYLHTWLLG